MLTDGAKFIVRAGEMKGHLTERTDHHRERWEFYKGEVKRHEETMARYKDIEDELTKVTVSNMTNLRDQAKRGAEQHAKSYFKYLFLSEHLTGDDYVLEIEELVALGFIRDQW